MVVVVVAAEVVVAVKQVAVLLKALLTTMRGSLHILLLLLSSLLMHSSTALSSSLSSPLVSRSSKVVGFSTLAPKTKVSNRSPASVRQTPRVSPMSFHREDDLVRRVRCRPLDRSSLSLEVSTSHHQSVQSMRQNSICYPKSAVQARRRAAKVLSQQTHPTTTVASTVFCQQ